MKLKDKLLTSLLPAFAASFTFLLFGPLEIYIGNAEELGFDIKAIFGCLLGLFFATFFIVAGILFVLPKKVHMIGYWFFFWLSVAGYIQGNFLNSGIRSLIDDGVGSKISPSTVVINTILWVVFIGMVVVAAILNSKTKWIRIVSLFMLVLMVGMQLAASVQVGIEYANYVEHKSTMNDILDTGLKPGTEDNYIEEIDKGTYVLTDKGLYNVSNKKNIVVFIIDRFDISYYEDIIEHEPDFFGKYNDFTLYTDNISTYSRTYPAVTHILTGCDFTGEISADEYFKTAYRNSNFLYDLIENGYRIKIYSQDYYAYRSGNALAGIAHNMERTEKEGEIKDKWGLTFAMLGLSVYRYLPIVAKNVITISSSTFANYLSYEDIEGKYNMTDNNNYEVYSGLRTKGLSFDDSEKSFTFIHVLGVHDPINMDENGELVDSPRAYQTAMGCMNMVYEYIQEMKRLGVYDDSMIIVTGDHPRSRDDFEYPSQPRITTLLVKYPGVKQEELKVSDAQVSEDMFIPTIIKEMKIETANTYYDKTYRDMETYEGNITRRHIFEYDYSKAKLLEYHITGNGRDFSNWELYKETSIGDLYK